MSTIKLKKSSIASKVPTTSDLVYGEIALNYQDGKLYYKTASNTIENFLDSSGVVAAIDARIDSNSLVHITGTETITGLKDFTSRVTLGPGTYTKGYTVSSPQLLSLERDSGSFLNILTDLKSDCGINFGDSDTLNVGSIFYSHDTNKFTFRANSVSFTKIDSAGVHVGGSDSGNGAFNAYGNRSFKSYASSGNGGFASFNASLSTGGAAFEAYSGTASTSTFVDFDAPLVTSGNVDARFFRGTNTTSPISFAIYQGDGTGTIQHKFERNQVLLSAQGGKVQIGSYTTPQYSLDIDATDGILIPVGSTTQRPTAAMGVIRFNKTLGQFEGYDSTSWSTLGAPSSGYVLTTTAQNVGGTKTFTSNINVQHATKPGIDLIDSTNLTTARINTNDFGSIEYKADVGNLNSGSVHQWFVDDSVRMSMTTGGWLGIGKNAATPVDGIEIDLGGLGITTTALNGAGGYARFAPASGAGGAKIFAHSGDSNINTFIDLDATGIVSGNISYRFGRATNSTHSSNFLDYFRHNGTGQVVHRLATTYAILSADSSSTGVTIGNLSGPRVSLDIFGTDAVQLPVGTTAQRPTVSSGQIRFNSTTKNFEGWDSASWVDLTATGGGSSATSGAGKPTTAPPAVGAIYIDSNYTGRAWIGIRTDSAASWNALFDSDMVQPLSTVTVMDSADKFTILKTGTDSAVAVTLGNVIHGIPADFVVAATVEDSDMKTGVSQVTFRMPYAMTLTDVRANVKTASVGNRIAVDINEAGVSILSTKLTIDSGEKTSVTAAIPPVISDINLADDAEITIDLDSVGTTTAGRGLKIVLKGTYA